MDVPSSGVLRIFFRGGGGGGQAPNPPEIVYSIVIAPPPPEKILGTLLVERVWNLILVGGGKIPIWSGGVKPQFDKGGEINVLNKCWS